MAKIENFQLIAKPGEMTRGIIACKVNYKSEDERVLNETSGQLESPIGKESWREEAEHEFFSKTSIDETEIIGKEVG